MDGAAVWKIIKIILYVIGSTIFIVLVVKIIDFIIMISDIIKESFKAGGIKKKKKKKKPNE